MSRKLVEKSKSFHVEFYVGKSWWRDSRDLKSVSAAETYRKKALAGSKATKSRITTKETKIYVVK